MSGTVIQALYGTPTMSWECLTVPARHSDDVLERRTVTVMGSGVVLETVTAAARAFGCVQNADFRRCLARNDVGEADYSPMPGKLSCSGAGLQPLGASSQPSG